MMATNNRPTKEEVTLAKALQRAGVEVEVHKPFPYQKADGTIGHIHADVCIEFLKLIIEVDGNHHKNTADQSRRDKLRDKTIRSHGYDVQHIGNALVNDPKELREFVEWIINDAYHKDIAEDYQHDQEQIAKRAEEKANRKKRSVRTNRRREKRSLGIVSAIDSIVTFIGKMLQIAILIIFTITIGITGFTVAEVVWAKNTWWGLFLLVLTFTSLYWSIKTMGKVLNKF